MMAGVMTLADWVCKFDGDALVRRAEFGDSVGKILGFTSHMIVIENLLPVLGCVG